MSGLTVWLYCSSKARFERLCEMATWGLWSCVQGRGKWVSDMVNWGWVDELLQEWREPRTIYV